MKQSLPLIESEFRRSVQRHRSEIEALATAGTMKWSANGCSTCPPRDRPDCPETWTTNEKTSVANFGDLPLLWCGWRAAYDTPLIERIWWEEVRFVEDEAVPVFEERMDEIVANIQRIIADVAANPEVRKNFPMSQSPVQMIPRHNNLSEFSENRLSTTRSSKMRGKPSGAARSAASI